MTSSELRLTSLDKISIALQSCPAGEPTTTWQAWWGEGGHHYCSLIQQEGPRSFAGQRHHQDKEDCHTPPCAPCCPGPGCRRECNVSIETEKSWHGRATRKMEERDLAGVQFLPSKDLHNCPFLFRSPLLLSHLLVKVRKLKNCAAYFVEAGQQNNNCWQFWRDITFISWHNNLDFSCLGHS